MFLLDVFRHSRDYNTVADTRTSTGSVLTLFLFVPCNLIGLSSQKNLNTKHELKHDSFDAFECSYCFYFIMFQPHYTGIWYL
jgi:hypothetical protein